MNFAVWLFIFCFLYVIIALSTEGSNLNVGKNTSNTKSRIISAAWRLFYEQGYDDTTVEEIVSLSETSKGSFYHYFEGKDALLSTLSTLFDEKYEELLPTVDPSMDSFERLMYFNRELFSMIENSVSLDLLAQLLSTQLTAKGERHLLDRNRTYFKVLRKTVKDGQERGELRSDISANEIVKAYALTERALLYDWCLCSGDYSLSTYANPLLRNFFNCFKTEDGK